MPDEPVVQRMQAAANRLLDALAAEPDLSLDEAIGALSAALVSTVCAASDDAPEFGVQLGRWEGVIQRTIHNSLKRAAQHGRMAVAHG